MRMNPRNKGKRGELEIARILREHGYGKCRRGQQYSGTETSADVVGIDGLHIEVKRTEKFQLYAALEQAKRDAGESGNIPVVFHRSNNHEWVTVLRLTDFLNIYGNAETEANSE